MLIQSTVLFTVILCCDAIVFDRNYTRPYELKETWVKNFIKFHYVFEGKQAKAKIVPVGCVPSNTADGKVLKAGGRYHGHDFVFSCEQTEDGIMSYEAIACVDAFGAEMRVGETRTLSNGTVVLQCNVFGGALKKVVQRVAGCYFNETIYGEERQWVEPILRNKKFSSKFSSTGIASRMSGRLMQCFRPHYSYYESHVVGCVVGRVGLMIDEYFQLSDGTVVQCVEDEKDHVTLIEAKIEDLSCKMDNITHQHGEKWVDHKKSANMQCNFGHISKYACFIDNSSYPIGQELKISNGCVFLCHPQTNVYICDEKLGEFTITDDHPNRKEETLKKLVV